MCLNNKEYFAWFNKSRDLIIKDNGVKLEHLFRVPTLPWKIVNSVK